MGEVLLDASRALLAKNPFGKIPVFEDGDLRLRESSAICSYLADKHPEKGLLPKPGTSDRALCFLYPEKTRIPGEIAVAHADFKALATTLERELPGDHAVGGRFTLADLTLAYTLKWSRIERVIGADLLATFPRLIEYAELHTSRSAFPRELYSS